MFARSSSPSISKSSCFALTEAFMLEPIKFTRKLSRSMFLIAPAASEGMVGLISIISIASSFKLSISACVDLLFGKSSTPPNAVTLALR